MSKGIIKVTTVVASTGIRDDDPDGSLHLRWRCGLEHASSHGHCCIVFRTMEIYGQFWIATVTAGRTVSNPDGKSVRAGDPGLSSYRPTLDSFRNQWRVSISTRTRSRVAGRLGHLWARSHLYMTSITKQ